MKTIRERLAGDVFKEPKPKTERLMVEKNQGLSLNTTRPSPVETAQQPGD